MKKTQSSIIIAVLVLVFSIFTVNLLQADAVSSKGVFVSKCPLITAFMKSGQENNFLQVIRLQSFLNTFEGAGISITGIFDEDTEKSVKSFQEKYANIVLTPWGATKSSGIVNITTAKKINEIACGIPLTLNNQELDTINNFSADVNIETVSATNPDQSVSNKPTIDVEVVGKDSNVNSEVKIESVEISTSTIENKSSDTKTKENKPFLGQKFLKFIQAMF